jgi:FkbM family methyltransferase
MNFEFTKPSHDTKKIADFSADIDILHTALEYADSKENAIDIGAHIGIISRELSKNFKSVFSFEPLWSDYTKKNMEDLDNVKIYSIGLGEHDTTEEIYIMKNNTGGSSILTHPRRTWQKNAQKQLIEIKPLDYYNFTNVGLIKIDVESYELPVLRGAKNTLQKNNPVILIELMTKYEDSKYPVKDTISFLNSLGYIEIKKVGDNRIFKKD